MKLPPKPSPGGEWHAPNSRPEFVISRTATIWIDQEPYKYHGVLETGRIYLMHMHSGLPYLHQTGCMRELPCPEDWDDLLLAGRLRVIEPPSKLTARLIARMTDWDYRAIVGRKDKEGNPLPPVAGEDLPLEPDAAKMLAVVLLLDEKGTPNGVIAIRKELAKSWPGEFEDRFGPHHNPETIRRWRAERGTPGDRHLADFVRMWGRVPRKRYGDGVVDLILQKMLLRKRTERGTVDSVRDELGTLLGEINRGEHPDYEKPVKDYPTPSSSKVWRAWRALENHYTVQSEEGDAIMRSEWCGSGRPLVAKYPLQLAIVDHTRIPVAAVIDLENDILITEVWLTTLIDVCTRVCLGWVITAFAPSLWTVAEVIRRSNLPKRPPPQMAKDHPILRRICGRVSEIIVDNGREFRGHGLEDAARSGGFAVRFAPIKRPTYKGIGERLFRTVKEKIAKRLPGYMIPIERARKGEYDAKIKAVVTLDDLEALMNQAMAEYHTEDHDGLQNRQPALVFQKMTGGKIEICHDLEQFMLDVMDVRFKVQVDKAGVTRWGLRFFDPLLVPDLLDDLAPIEPRRRRRDAVTATPNMKLKPMDIGRIPVWNRKPRKYVTLRCEHSNYSDGMPLELHKQILAQAKAEAAAFNTEEQQMAARSRRIQAIRNIDITANREQREELARLNEIPRIQQITGNIVDVVIEPATAVTLDDFIHHDRAAVRSIDAEISAPRKPVSEDGSAKPRRIPARDRRRKAAEDPDRDARDAGQPRQSPNPQPDVAARPRRSGSSRTTSGKYK